MERLYGQTWRAILRERKTIERDTLTVWLAQLCDALVAAHGKGVVHRDLKPENVIVRETEDLDATQLKVLDFGIAKQIDGQGDTDGSSVSGQIMGTLGYMAPEQLAAKTVDHRADIFAVGVMAWEALCGYRPFEGSTAAELAIAMQKRTATPPIAIEPALRQRPRKGPFRRCRSASRLCRRAEAEPALGSKYTKQTHLQSPSVLGLTNGPAGC